jgi:primosomal protein N' (replication factor Y)
VREELEALLRVPVAEMSGRPTDTTATPAIAMAAATRAPATVWAADGGAPDRAGAAVAARATVGTEAALHRIRQAELVAFLDFDQHLLAPRFTAAEEALGLLARAGRLVGGRAGADPGGAPADGARPLPAVLVQTRIPDHEVLRAAAQGDPLPLLRSEGAMREQLGLPPSSALALVSGESAGEYVVRLAPPAAVDDGDVGGDVGGDSAHGDLGAGLDGGRDGGVWVSALGDDRWLLRADRTRTLCDALAATPRPRGRLRVEVDPTSV